MKTVKINLASIQDQSNKLYRMLLSVSSDDRNEVTQYYIDTLVTVLKSLPTNKPIEFNSFVVQSEALTTAPKQGNSQREQGSL